MLYLEDVCYLVKVGLLGLLAAAPPAAGDTGRLHWKKKGSDSFRHLLKAEVARDPILFFCGACSPLLQQVGGGGRGADSWNATTSGCSLLYNDANPKTGAHIICDTIKPHK